MARTNANGLKFKQTTSLNDVLIAAASLPVLSPLASQIKARSLLHNSTMRSAALIPRMFA